ncbi:MAG: TonB-dependent receptor, partial [Candidatus Saccharibacteria bacterium]|nr:TonB-dependent receptor [Candidatus Saccharibacteria bacterium]
SGLTDFSAFKRTTLRSNIDTKVNDWLSMGINHSVAYTDRESDGYTVNGTSNVRSASSTAVMYAPYWDPYDEESQRDHLVWGQGANGYDNKWLQSVQPRQVNDIVYNGTAYLQITPFRGLTLRSQLGLYATETRMSDRILPSAAELLGATATASEYFDRNTMWTITNTAEYKFNIGKDHAVTLLAGQEGIKSDVYALQATVSGMQDDRLLMMSNGTTAELPSDSKSKYEYLSFFGRADYAYRDKYFANFTVRSDASSRFGSANRTALFYSGGLMWDVTHEEFMKEITWLINSLQVKASVGSTGNSEIGDYAHLGITGNTMYDRQMAWYFAQYAASDLGWEKQIQANLGFSVRIMDELSLDVNVYNRKTKNMLMSTPLPYTSALGSQMRNIGEMTNRGVELELSYDVIRTKDLYVNIRANYSYNKNVVDKLFYNLSEWPMNSSLISYIVGESLNFYMPIYAGVDETDGAPMWYKKGYSGKAGYKFNPETMTKDATSIEDIYQDTGKPRQAPHFGGFGLTASWKGLTLSAD